MNKRKQKVIIASILSITIFGVALLNLFLYIRDRANLEEASKVSLETVTEDEVIVINVPEIKDNKDDIESEAVNNVEDSNVNSQANPSYPEGMLQPSKEVPKPVDPPTSDNVVVTAPVVTKTPVKSNTAPVTVTNDKPKVPEGGGTGSDGKVYDMNGNVLDWAPATDIQEVNGSDLEGQFEMGQGDKF